MTVLFTVVLFISWLWHVIWCSLQSSSKKERPNPLSPNSDDNEIFLYFITACSNIQVMRIKETITKDKMS